MKKTFFGLLSAFVLSLCFSVRVNAADNKLFPYPVAPDSVMNLTSRCNFLVDHFWDRCNFKTVFSSLDRLNAAFGDWTIFIPHASADTVHIAIDRLINNVRKSGPNTLSLARIAEGWLYSDTSEIFSEEVYLPFARAAAQHKKISGADRARFESQAKQIESSGIGAIVPPVGFTLPDGGKTNLGEVKSQYVVLFFSDPECEDCSLATLRLSVDMSTRSLIDSGVLSIVCLYPGDSKDSKWAEKTASLPSSWVAGANPDLDEYFDLRTSPAFFLLDKDHKVMAKNIYLDNLLNAFSILNQTER